MWHIFVFFLSAIFAAAWGGESQLSILYHEGAKVRNVSSHLNVKEGTTFTLTCTSKPHQPSTTDDLVWQEIGSYSHTTSNGLTFEPIRLEDGGEYLCVDKKGNIYKSVKINVQPKEKRNDHQVKVKSPSLEKLYKEAQKLAQAEKNNPQSKNWDELINLMLEVIAKNENLIQNLTAIALEELKNIEKPKSEEPVEPEHVKLSPKSGGVGEVERKHKNFVELTLSPADEDFLHEVEEGKVNSNHLESPATKEPGNEEAETTTESLEEEGETEEVTEATTTEASSEEYYDEEEYSEEGEYEEEKEENEKEKEEKEEEEEGNETEEPSYEKEETETGKPNLSNFKYTVETENPESAESKEIVFPDNEPKEVFNRYGGSDEEASKHHRLSGMNAIYSDYFEESSNNENGKEEETATAKETSTLDAALLNKLKPYLNKHLGRKHPAEMPPSTEPPSSNSEEPMQVAINEINSEVQEMSVFKYIVGVILLILVILLLAFIIRIWHLLEFKVSHDSPLPPQQYVPLISSAEHAEVDDATETLLP